MEVLHAHHRLPRGTPARRWHLRLSRLPAASTCSISLPRSRTRGRNAAAGTRWRGCWPWGSRQSSPARSRSPRSGSGPPMPARSASRRGPL